MKYQISIIALALCASSSLYADDAQQKIELNNIIGQACLDKDEGDLCQFENESGDSISGQCKRSGSADSALSCVPNGQ